MFLLTKSNKICNFALLNEIITMDNTIIEQALQVLQKGGILLYPTDTIWGLGCDATNVAAIEKIYSIKKRDAAKSMLILCSDVKQAKNYVVSFPKAAEELLLRAQRPTTIIYPQACNLPDVLVANDGSIGIRIPDMEFCSKLLRRFGKPIVSTSANFSGMPSPIGYNDISPELKDMVDYAVPNLPEFAGSATGSRILKVETDGSITTIRN